VERHETGKKGKDLNGGLFSVGGGKRWGVEIFAYVEAKGARRGRVNGKGAGQRRGL